MLSPQNFYVELLIYLTDVNLIKFYNQKPLEYGND